MHKLESGLENETHTFNNNNNKGTYWVYSCGVGVFLDQGGFPFVMQSDLSDFSKKLFILIIGLSWMEVFFNQYSWPSVF